MRRVWAGLAMAIALASITAGGVVIATQDGDASAANAWVNTSAGSCTRSATPVTYETAVANGWVCGTIDAAWVAASSGDTIRVKAGTYNEVDIVGNKTSTTKVIGEDGVTIGDGTMTCVVAFGGSSALCLDAGGDHLWLENVDINSGTSTGTAAGTKIWPGTDNVTFVDVNFRGDFAVVNVQGDTFRWDGGELGNDEPVEDMEEMTCTNGAWLPFTLEPGSQWSTSTAAVIDNVVFHARNIQDSPTPNVGACGPDGLPHLEIMRPNSSEADNWTLRGSFFKDCPECGSGFIFASATISGAKIIGNYFGDVVSPAFSKWAEMSNVSNMTIAYNTFSADEGVWAGGQTGFVWVGNLGVEQGCSGTHTKNVWHGSGSCGTDTYTGGSYAALEIGSDGKIGATSPAIDAAETPGASDYCTDADYVNSVDFEGTVRPQGSVCDAGYDER